MSFEIVLCLFLSFQHFIVLQINDILLWTINRYSFAFINQTYMKAC